LISLRVGDRALPAFFLAIARLQVAVSPVQWLAITLATGSISGVLQARDRAASQQSLPSAPLLEGAK
jgi:hypothetical protein